MIYRLILFWVISFKIETIQPVDRCCCRGVNFFLVIHISFKIETWKGKFNLSTEAVVGAVKDVSLSLAHSWKRDIIGIVFHSQFRVESVFLRNCLQEIFAIR